MNHEQYFVVLQTVENKLYIYIHIYKPKPKDIIHLVRCT